MKAISMRLVIISLFAAACISGVSAISARAAEDDVITDAQIEAIKTHCTDLQGTLNRLHQNDTLLRYNRGELYRTLSDKLMSPLNQRIASNQLDGGNLVRITASYNTAYQTFFNAYKDYETSLSAALGIDCTRQPTRFYDQVRDARTKRNNLHTASAALVTIAKQYKQDFDAFRKTVIDKAAS